jgi:hypothetical protein
MKTVIPKIWGACLLLLALNTSAQSCDSLVDFSLDNVNTEIQQGFVSADAISCIQTGQEVEMLLPFIAYRTIPSGQGYDSVTQITFNSVDNLPCGLCWGMNKASHTYEAGEPGCIIIRGNTGSPLGQYTLDIQVTVFLQGGGSTQTTIAAIAGTNGKIILRIIDADGSVQAINYGITGNISSPCN